MDAFSLTNLRILLVVCLVMVLHYGAMVLRCLVLHYDVIVIHYVVTLWCYGDILW
jgi:hypothetical protein